MLLPLALAVLLSFLLTPMANRLERWGLPRIPAVITIAGISFAVMGILIWIVWLQAKDLGTQLETYQGNVVAKIRAVREGSGPFSKFADTLEKMAREIQDKKGASPNSSGGKKNDSESAKTPDAPPQMPDDAPVEVKVVETTSARRSFLPGLARFSPRWAQLAWSPCSSYSCL